MAAWGAGGNGSAVDADRGVGGFYLEIKDSMFFKRKKELVLTKHKIEQHSVLTCPACGHKRIAAMPTPAASFRYQCSKCETVNETVECCVFCSFGSVKCMQKQRAE